MAFAEVDVVEAGKAGEAAAEGFDQRGRAGRGLCEGSKVEPGGWQGLKAGEGLLVKLETVKGGGAIDSVAGVAFAVCGDDGGAGGHGGNGLDAVGGEAEVADGGQGAEAAIVIADGGEEGDVVSEARGHGGEVEWSAAEEFAMGEDVP